MASPEFATSARDARGYDTGSAKRKSCRRRVALAMCNGVGLGGRSGVGHGHGSSVSPWRSQTWDCCGRCDGWKALTELGTRREPGARLEERCWESQNGRGRFSSLEASDANEWKNRTRGVLSATPARPSCRLDGPLPRPAKSAYAEGRSKLAVEPPSLRSSRPRPGWGQNWMRAGPSCTLYVCVGVILQA